MIFLYQLLTIALIHLLAVVSPGPDFILITRNSLVYSRKTGRYSAIGLGLGILVHVFYSIVGISLIISKSILLFSVIKFIGAFYLLYIGYKSLTHKKSDTTIVTGEVTKKEDLTATQALKMGFVTNVTNPKVTLFFFSLFTQIINPSTPLLWQIIYGLEMAVVTAVWFFIVATIFSHTAVRERVSKVQVYTEKVMGILLIAFGVKLALSKAN